MTMETLSILIPVYNEAGTLDTVLRRVLEVPLPVRREVVAVDDGSTDGSWELLRRWQAEDPRVVAVQHRHNQGKGAAIRTAIAHMSGQVAVVQDADLEYDPAELPRLLQPILEEKADAVFGSRYAGATRQVHPYWHTLVNRFLTWVSNMLTDLSLTDMETCYKMIRADVLRQLRLSSCTFTLEPELTCRLAQWGARIWEVPISYHRRTWEEGKKIGPIDGLKALGAMVRYAWLDRRYTNHAGVWFHVHLEQQKRFRHQVAQGFLPYLGRSVLQLGAGTGAWVPHLLECERVLLVEPDEVLRHRLRVRWGNYRHVEIAAGLPAETAQEPAGQFDALLVTPDGITKTNWSALVAQALEHLAPHGHLILLAPDSPGQDAPGTASLRQLARRGQWQAVGQAVVKSPRKLRRAAGSSRQWSLAVYQVPQIAVSAKAA